MWQACDHLYKADFARVNVERESKSGVLQRLILSKKMKIPEMVAEDRKQDGAGGAALVLQKNMTEKKQKKTNAAAAFENSPKQILTLNNEIKGGDKK